ncbi:MAG: tRNA (N(6)-L-threonylcarbamoyladenosine(37)-C(2))-methylthiotransferase MtaB [Candidatus Hydrogenedentes bacterium]|nr:tRNA (N(6)-L-threonylcarbamoyladenosine(37)-C(2))-methylthiotransferase MtaB [Candidatus Hydrogenedentota bacterium]
MSEDTRTGKRASIHTLGCRLNQSESGILAEQLERAGYTIVPFGEPADLGVINTCTVTREAGAKSRQSIRSFIRKNPHAYTAAIGCYSQMEYKTLSEIAGLDLIIGTQEKLRLLDYVAEGKNDGPVIVRDRIQRGDFTIETAGGGPVTKRTNLKIQDGCDFMCSFCIIPFARGRSRSRELEDLVDEARQLACRGAKEIVLTGVNLGCYQQQGRDIVDVVERLNGIPGLARIRISSIEPTTIPEALFAFMDAPDHALVPYLHVPAQSGSNRMLSRMRRRHTREEFVAFIERAQSAIRDVCIGSDLMVGAPGEAEEDFAETVRLVEETPIAYAHVFKYSEREGTAASRDPDKVAPEVQNRRSAHLRRTVARKRRAFNASFAGRVLDVLFEEEDDGFWFGYTGNYIRVAARSDQCLTNVIRPVRLERARGDIVQGTLSDE